MQDKTERLKKELFKAVDRLAPGAIALSDHLAANPETGGEEFDSSRQHVELLKEAGFDVEYPFTGIPTAFRARKGKGTAKVALLAEYDALPTIGHACGHNVSGAMSTLAGIALAGTAGELDGQIQVIGTPAEETDGAKVAMAAKGVFDGLDLALMLHCAGGVSFVPYESLAVDALEFVFSGRTAHASASPWTGKNALNGLQLFFHAVDMLRQHVSPEVRMHGIITAGGEAPNIVPDRAAAKFYFRAPKRATVDEVVAKAKNCARGAALATETEARWETAEISFEAMKRNGPAEGAMEKIMEELGIRLSEAPGPEGSSDMGNVSRCCPALQPHLSITEGPIDLHTREFARATTAPEAHRAMIIGAKGLAAMTLAMMFDAELREAVKETYRKSG
ncbi:MAG: amidohydrolase [Thermovirgaceae bacterium]